MKNKTLLEQQEELLRRFSKEGISEAGLEWIEAEVAWLRSERTSSATGDPKLVAPKSVPARTPHLSPGASRPEVIRLARRIP